MEEICSLSARPSDAALVSGAHGRSSGARAPGPYSIGGGGSLVSAGIVPESSLAMGTRFARRS